ncbi:MAG: hypothetical protein OEV73_05670 [Desulfobulbaceae bacterium]|nr:hypothetical protein [Desulfobulbaceae bacterium]
MPTENSPPILRSLLTVALLVIVTELLIIAIHHFNPQLANQQPHGHALLHLLIVAPFIYFFLYKPLQEKSSQTRENIEALSRTHQMLLTVLDSLDAIVYVADIQTHELLFLNRFSRDIFGDGVGKPCWQVLQTNQTGPCEFCSNDKLVSSEGKIQGMYAWEFKNTVNGHWYDIRDRAIPWIDGRIVRLEIATDITGKKGAEEEKERMIEELRQALAEVKTLRGIIPICAYCKNIRDDHGYWNQVEAYLSKNSEADFSHGICPTCLQKHFPEIEKRQAAATPALKPGAAQ